MPDLPVERGFLTAATSVAVALSLVVAAMAGAVSVSFVRAALVRGAVAEAMRELSAGVAGPCEAAVRERIAADVPSFRADVVACGVSGGVASVLVAGTVPPVFHVLPDVPVHVGERVVLDR